MGQIAEDMVDGTCCSWCGMYFESKNSPLESSTHGYPVVCKRCSKGWTDKRLSKQGLQRAKHPTI